MAERLFTLSVFTPSRQIFDGAVFSLKAPGSAGYFQVLIGHIPMLTSLQAGILTIDGENGSQIYAVSGGFVEVLRQQTIVLAESVERADEINTDRAREAANRARQRLEAKDPAIDAIRAQAALNRALNRLKAAGASLH